jgi:hypothetical protein
MNKKAIFICGYGGAGKDALAGMIEATFGLSVGSSSFAARETVWQDYLTDDIRNQAAYDWSGLADKGELNADSFYSYRRTHRRFWHDRMHAMNLAGPGEIGLYYSMINANGADIITGVRRPDELVKLREQNLIHFSVWVARPGYVESGDSCPLTAQDCDYIIQNDGTLAGLDEKVQSVWRFVQDWQAAGPDEADWDYDEAEEIEA